jgi:DNA-binding NarL/FixJ family response regulator
LGVLAAMREAGDELKNIPAIVLSSERKREYKERAYALGAEEFFVKASDWDGFVAIAREVCAHLSDNAS